jgi:glycosyltransferase involved in cell wall biosynthesis
MEGSDSEFDCPTMMKVTHFSTFARGGAGIACRRLHESLLAFGVDSRAVFRDLDGYRVGGQAHPIKPRFMARIFRFPFKRWLIKPRVIQNNSSRMEIFTSPLSNFRVHQMKEFKSADIVHLHWIGDFLDYPTLFRQAKRYIWTVHDLNPFLGGLHYPIDQDRVSSDLLQIELRLRSFKHSILKRTEIHYVFPSRWILEQAKQLAPWLLSERIHLIHNCISANEFKYIDRFRARELLALPKQEKILLFISENVGNYRKGFDVLCGALDREFLAKNSLTAMAIGAKAEGVDSHIQMLGKIDSPSELALYYAAADVFVLPSRQDNLPNVMLEALAVGCPVVAFDTGGMSEVINEQNGVRFASFDVADLRAAIVKAMSQNYDRKSISIAALDTFRSEVIARKYSRLYRSLIDQSQP